MEWKYLILMLIAMLFMHVWDDFGCQGIMAQMKRKAWWKENAPAYMYRDDYKAALIAHAFSWSVFVMIPVAIPAFVFDNTYMLWALIPLLIFNTSFHAIVDHLKCNEYKVKLWENQLLHCTQIFLTWVVAVVFL